jgi:hypothetical protein
MSSRKLVSGAALGVIVSSLFVFGGGCLTRPVVAGNPVTKTNFTVGYSTTTIDKIDILFDIDNSSSMGDKQQYLQAAVPDLITRLVSPNCVDSMGNNIVVNGAQLVADSTTGNCTQGQAEFPPVHDMHIGVLTSSLGGRGTITTCQTSATSMATPAEYLEYTSGSYQTYIMDSANNQFPGLTSISKNNDDQGHLINRIDPVASPNATPGTLTGNFLAWVPAGSMDTAPVNGVSESSSMQLESDFQELVVGSQAYGCGIESQLESWYRFLIQPDPYASITTTKNTNGLLVASWSGIDTTILQQRADFLRPDSLVLIVVLTDEDDSEVDVRTIGGIGVNWIDNPFQPPQGTSACASNPSSSSCTSCAFGNNASDPNCKAGVFPADDTNWAYNNNLRHVHMKAKYGVDLQFPINRYVNGLTSLKVPNRTGEYPTNGNGYYQGGLNSDPQDLTCINPLFATNLPTTASGPTDSSICNLTPSTTRTPASNLVYYAHIGGVPQELLTTNVNGTITPKETLAASDWVSILGMDPENYNYSGIDPHMIESYQPRMGIPLNTAGPPMGDEAGDWYTDGEPSSTFPTRVNLPVDREYACVFKLATPRNCDPNNANNAESDISSCDCSTAGPGGVAPTLPADHVPAVCDTANPLQQDYAKTYPTIRELLLAEKLGTQGIVSSLCPIDLVDNSAGNDPLYGYRPAITTIIDRLKASLTTTCLPEALSQSEAGVVPCLVLVTLPSSTPQDNSQCTNTTMYPSLSVVDPTVLSEYKADQHAAYEANGAGGEDLSLYTTCEINQVLPANFQGSCKGNVDPMTPNSQGWCYITGSGSCPQSLQFSSKGLPAGGIVSLQCLENSSDFASGNGTGGGTSSSTATSSSSSGGATTH